MMQPRPYMGIREEPLQLSKHRSVGMAEPAPLASWMSKQPPPKTFVGDEKSEDEEEEEGDYEDEEEEDEYAEVAEMDKEEKAKRDKEAFRKVKHAITRVIRAC